MHANITAISSRQETSKQIKTILKISQQEYLVN